MAAVSRASCTALRSALSASSAPRRPLHQSARRYAISNFQMPAMSPTMSEGGIASWKVKEGEAFSAGDVLLEIETDKATIDVEAQDDGIMGKILVPDGAKNVPVGKLIALLAEEGDDIANIQIPKEEPAQSSSQVASPPPSPSAEPPAPPQPEQQAPNVHSGSLPSHSQPLFPSVHRLIIENGIQSLDAIKGTGVRGMITKGDVLTYLGKASGPNGTFKPAPTPIQEATKNLQKQAPAAEEAKPLDGDAIRRLIVNSMLQQSLKTRNPPPDYAGADFDSVLADYLPSAPKSTPATTAPSQPAKAKTDSFLSGLF
ncbi:pyruvate dehydrogenase X component [Coprinopsis cinerea okayama7|uniref:Pyruvate dehydrogenase X component n=1 Tax=Coprinopsis cinerea (strain Okayama-7 / 130 / ATCC MYA-4618 / FGSC 9003) TaxID=240176 RepID=A8NH10_COPC7|nr:pyruvate dehydrogenase X component [Coprinopsis cinerea okayama7\|eukprot:XP_001833650.1 pyruvate dehydrogenase X component [Coprinopsis cinerea okayama7\